MTSARRRTVSHSCIELVVGDITTLDVDAIVNAANSELAGGGGVDGAIHRAGGSEIMAETRRRHADGCATGSAVITGAGKLPAKWVVHAVGPIYRGGDQGEEEALRGAYRRSLELATEAGARSVAFPAISAGIYGYPLKAAAQVAIGESARGLRGVRRPGIRVVFCLFNETVYAAFAEALAALKLDD